MTCNCVDLCFIKLKNVDFNVIYVAVFYPNQTFLLLLFKTTVEYGQIIKRKARPLKLL